MSKQFLVSTAYYFAIALLAAFVGYLACVKGKRTAIRKIGKDVGELEITRAKNAINLPLYIMSALIIALPLIFTDKGVDRPTYISLFQTVTLEKIKDIQHQEPGFMLINLILKGVFGTNKYIPFIFYYGLMVFNVYYVIYKLRDKCCIPFSIFIFFTIYCIQSISLLRIYVAGSILLLASYQLLKNHSVKSLILWLFAISIHYSSGLFFIVYLITFYYRLLKDKYKIKTIVLLLMLAILFVIAVILIPLMENFAIIERYKDYLTNVSFTHIGFYQPILYVPLIILSIYFVKLYGNDGHEYIYMSNLISCFLYGMISYMIIILGRSFALFMYPFIIGIPYMYKMIKKRNKLCEKDNSLLLKGEHILSNQIILVFLVAYILFKFAVYMIGYIETDGIGIL